MKKSSESNNINIFDGNFENINKDENNLSIQKYFWTPNTKINTIIENFALANNFKKNLEIGPEYLYALIQCILNLLSSTSKYS